ncbi:unnamed protein product [Blepharisma stoltei]|uniref:Uncharacterized protein n=1 Tax=Blepharisma stoltei TaxID=1481888 RepID=A0AAU9K2X9_9CILI|nr:unnamed protein product [Blepharisma stoltei]
MRANRKLSSNHPNKSFSTTPKPLKTIKLHQKNQEIKNSPVTHAQNLVNNCKALQKKLAAIKDSFSQNQEFGSYYVSKILSQDYEEPKTFYKFDKAYLLGKAKIAHKKEAQEQDRKKQELIPLTWNKFEKLSKGFKKREFGKVKPIIDEKHRRPDLFLSRLNITITSESPPSSKLTGHKYQEKREPTLSIFKRKMKRPVTASLKNDIVSTDCTAPDMAENLSTQATEESKTETEKLLFKDCENLRSFDHQMNLEQLVRVKIKQLIHNTNGNLPLIKINNRLV